MADQFLTTKSVLGWRSGLGWPPFELISSFGDLVKDVDGAKLFLNGKWTMNGDSDPLLTHLRKIGDVGLFFVKINTPILSGPVKTYPFGILIWHNPCVLMQLSNGAGFRCTFSGVYFSNSWTVGSFSN